MSKTLIVYYSYTSHTEVEHVQYTQTDEEPFSAGIFTQEKSKSDFLKPLKQ